MDEIVSAQWLRANIDDVRAVDVRWYRMGAPPACGGGRSGRAAYDAGHIPGAVWIDLDTDLSAPASKADGRHPLPAPETFAAALGRLGIAAGTPVIAYDGGGAPGSGGAAAGGAAGSVAARLWWLLRSIGEPVAVLDGGIGAWQDAGGELSTLAPSPQPVTRTPRPWPADAFVTADDVAAGGAVVLDARSAERYAHGDPAVDPRGGHIPGARSAPWTDNIDPDTGRLRDPAALRERFAALGVDDGSPVVAYCGSGVTACHDLLALTRAGFGNTALYPGSWSQWGADESRAAETG